MERPGWHAHAACRSQDPDVFFDGPLAKAITVCETCPVQPQCLTDAMADASLQGVWGGTTEHQRRRMRRSATTPEPGTPAGPQTASVPNARPVPSGKRYSGVSLKHSGRYSARWAGISLGRFDTADEAAAACEAMRQSLARTAGGPVADQ